MSLYKKQYHREALYAPFLLIWNTKDIFKLNSCSFLTF
jgi:hypothetical protein